MTKGIYLGNSGSVEIERSSLNAPLASVLNPSDVNANTDRFSFDFDSSSLTTGDDIEIYTEDRSDLELVSGHSFPDWRGYVHVDDAGGVRLYDNFNSAILGSKDDCLQLVTPSKPQPIAVRTRGAEFRYVAQISSYELTTSRESIDLTSLGDEERKNYTSGLISGQGSMSCLWSYKRGLCDLEGCAKEVELPQYFAQLILRLKQGSNFVGRFNLLVADKESVWYEAQTCIVTNVAVAMQPSDLVRMQIEFITSGPIKLHVGQPPAYLQLEDTQFNEYVLQEDGSRLELEDD